MIEVTHAMTTNGRIHGPFKDSIESPFQLLRTRLDLLDGVRRYSLSLWRLPEGVPFDRVKLATWPQEYLQVAGSASRMTIEIRRFEGEVPKQYVVGRPPVVNTAPDVVIPWNAHEVKVHPNEVFDASEAAEVFGSYFLKQEIPKTYLLRLLRI